MIKPRATTPIAASALNLSGLADWRLSFFLFALFAIRLACRLQTAAYATATMASAVSAITGGHSSATVPSACHCAVMPCSRD
jgi:hypothetical protein